MASAGRPRIEIDKEEFEKLCGFQSTLLEIAGWFRCSEKDIESWCKRTYKTVFSDIYKRLSTEGKSNLRRAQYQKALEGNVTMLIFLGRQYLDQKDRTKIDHTEALEKLDAILTLFDGNL